MVCCPPSAGLEIALSDPTPLSLNQQIDVTIESLAFGGEGVGRVNGVPVFVADVCPGERVVARVTDARRNFARARVVELDRPAPERTPPLCPLHGTCGGCDWQHVDYPAQVAAKTRIVRDTLARVGHLPDVPVAETIASPVPYGYRNKVELAAFTADDGALALGYPGRDAAQLVAVDQCPIALPEVNALIDQVGAWLSATGWPAYDPDSSEGLVREVGLRCSTSTREATVLLTTGRRELPEKGPWIDSLRRELPQIVGFRHFARTRASQTAVGKPVGDLHGRPLRFKVAGLSLRVSPEAFFQVNEFLLEALVGCLREALEPAARDHVADLYGGVGTFGLSLAREVGRSTILEFDSAAAHDARANVQFNKLDNVEVIRGQVEQQFGAVHRDRRVDLVILDPPRRGCSEGVIQLIARAQPRRVAYVSCDPATLARDLQRFAAAGYQTLRVQPVDLFPQTYHIESVATLAPGAAS